MTTSLLPQHKSKGRFYGYLRVSTPRQGKGVSLLTQREGIERFAAKHHLLVIGWFEEKKTAAKRGRPIFREVLKLLRQGKADGLIVHKWTALPGTSKAGPVSENSSTQVSPVYFAGEDIDMNTRSGRLAADIEAVIAADYIRNLREEAKRGNVHYVHNVRFRGPYPGDSTGSLLRGQEV
jgi:DNA invertase Pin-like site-specific DNA recombinase